eukprot:GHVH01004936.1.p1 GENE.GHVH01004936.1~~GHVH01004936.1.p1  ORF type:complete len:509 (-),score=77.83 GHVH01004936.1:617-2143(-)
MTTLSKDEVHLSKDEVQLKVLSFLKEVDSTTTFDIHHALDISHESVVGACMSLAFNNQVEMNQTQRVTIELTQEGQMILERGQTPEMMVAKHLYSLEPKSASLSVLKEDLDDFANGMRYCQAKRWTRMENGNLTLQSMPSVDDVYEFLQLVERGMNEQEISVQLKADCAKQVAELKKRKVINVNKMTIFDLVKGDAFSSSLLTYATDITKDMLLNGEAEKAEFRPMNFNASGTPIVHGSVHPLMAMRKKFKKVLMMMGFEEMKTDQWVESSFWNFDALFQPQQHPARDAHDTFFLKEPQFALKESFPKEYFDLVAQTHEKGGFGSIGWRYPYSTEETCKNILRTHTTSCSSRHLYQLAEEYKKTGIFVPKKYFSIDRVFRNETLDATHLAEFHQVEGLIAGPKMSLADLMGFMKNFYEKIGIKDLRFKPAYNPYTEPSMEIFGFHEAKNAYMEVGNSGIFRPEMLRPMGLPEDISVIAWGLGLDRMTMIRYNISNIRDLFGYKSVIGN